MTRASVVVGLALAVGVVLGLVVTYALHRDACGQQSISAALISFTVLVLFLVFAFLLAGIVVTVVMWRDPKRLYAIALLAVALAWPVGCAVETKVAPNCNAFRSVVAPAIGSGVHW